MAQGLDVKAPASEHRWFSGPEFLKKFEYDYAQEKSKRTKSLQESF